MKDTDMSKKLYNINVETLKQSTHLHKEVSNPTCVAIIKTLYKMSRAEDFRGATGDEILKEAVKLGEWSTRQVESKYMTTWAYYVKSLKQHAGVREVGEVAGTSVSIADLLEIEETEQE